MLRLRPGDAVVLPDGSGSGFRLELTGLAAGEAVGRIVASRAKRSGPALAAPLYAAPLKGGHVAWTLQKCTEVGAAAFVPILTGRTVARVGGVAGKLDRWRRIVREADEQ